MNSVEEEVVNNRMKVEKAVYANKNNQFRINQAENKIKQLPEINEKTEKEKFRNSLRQVSGIKYSNQMSTYHLACGDSHIT